MGANWDSGFIHWKDHAPPGGVRYPLAHLHPFLRMVEMPASDKHPARTVRMYVSFGLHTFTRATELRDGSCDLYRDNREVRTFCKSRYEKSIELPGMMRTIEFRRCEFAGSGREQMNYITVEFANGSRYAAFFSLRRFARMGADAVHLLVQSAYLLAPSQPTPGRGRIHFHALLGHTLRGTTPKPPA